MCLPSNQSDRHESLFLSLYLSTASVTLVSGGVFTGCHGWPCVPGEQMRHLSNQLLVVFNLHVSFFFLLQPRSASPRSLHNRFSSVNNQCWVSKCLCLYFHRSCMWKYLSKCYTFKKKTLKLKQTMGAHILQAYKT